MAKQIIFYMCGTIKDQSCVVAHSDDAQKDNGRTHMTETAPMDPTDVDVCICTFRRPHIEKTLTSIARQNLNVTVVKSE